MSRIFGKWNEGELGGYLLEITTACLAKVDPETGKPLVDLILDKAGQKGTGKWTSQNALDLGVAIPTIDMAVECRILSAFKDQRVAASKILKGPRARVPANKTAFIRACRDALHLAIISCYAQGLALLREASKEYQYDLQPGRDRPHLEGRVHHPVETAGPDRRGVQEEPRPAEPAGGQEVRPTRQRQLQGHAQGRHGVGRGGRAGPRPGVGPRCTSTRTARPPCR